MAGSFKRVVAIDCMTLIWGVRKKGPPEKIKHAAILFDQLDNEDATIILPSIVVAEYLTAVPGKDHERTITAMKRFQIEPFDVRDASLAARLWNEGKTKRQMGTQGARIALRADSLIIATAKNRGAQEFFTEDSDCLKMAAKIMTASRLPTMSPFLPGIDPKTIS